MSYEDLARSLAALRSGSGSPEQRTACADLAAAFFHYELVELARALRREGFEVSVFEDVTLVRIRLNGTSVTLERFSGQSELRLELLGFDGRVVDPDQRRQVIDLGTPSVAEIQSKVVASVEAIGAAWRAELALRHPGAR